MSYIVTVSSPETSHLTPSSKVSSAEWRCLSFSANFFTSSAWLCIWGQTDKVELSLHSKESEEKARISLGMTNMASKHTLHRPKHRTYQISTTSAEFARFGRTGMRRCAKWIFQMVRPSVLVSVACWNVGLQFVVSFERPTFRASRPKLMLLRRPDLACSCLLRKRLRC